MFKRKETLKSKGGCSDRRAQQLLRISPHQTLGVPGEKVCLSVHTHTARQHNREADKGPDTKTKTAGFYTRRSRDGEKNKEWLPDEAKEDQDLGWIRAQARPPDFFLSPRGRNKEARRKMNRGNRRETSRRATDPSISKLENRQRAQRNSGTSVAGL